MSDHNERLRSTLRELHHELEQMQHLDPDVRAQLKAAAGEIDAKLGHAAGAPSAAAAEVQPSAADTAEDDSLAGQLTDAARQFEGEHPTLAGILQRLVTGLSQLGI